MRTEPSLIEGVLLNDSQRFRQRGAHLSCDAQLELPVCIALRGEASCRARGVGSVCAFGHGRSPPLFM
jgi:hypothetical protein